MRGDIKKLDGSLTDSNTAILASLRGLAIKIENGPAKIPRTAQESRRLGLAPEKQGPLGVFSDELDEDAFLATLVDDPEVFDSVHINWELHVKLCELAVTEEKSSKLKGGINSGMKMTPLSWWVAVRHCKHKKAWRAKIVKLGMDSECADILEEWKSLGLGFFCACMHSGNVTVIPGMKLQGARASSSDTVCWGQGTGSA